MCCYLSGFGHGRTSLSDPGGHHEGPQVRHIQRDDARGLAGGARRREAVFGEDSARQLTLDDGRHDKTVSSLAVKFTAVFLPACCQIFARGWVLRHFS